MPKSLAQKYKIILPALCWGRGRHDFYAVTDGLSSSGIRFRSATLPLVDEELTCSIRHVGQLHGCVVRSASQAFVVRILANKTVLDQVARQLLHLSAQQDQPVVPRAHPRITPARTDVTIELTDGRVLPGRLLNVSASGVAFTLDASLEIGNLVMIGRTWARIARHFDNGVGAVFVTPLDPRDVGEQITL